MKRGNLILFVVLIGSLLLLYACGAPQSINVAGNQVYVLPGEKVTVEVNTGVQSLVGVWRSVAPPDLFVDGENITKRALTLSLFGPESTGVLSATVTNTIPWGNQLGREMRDVIVPVKIEVPANAPVPSIWSGNLIGKIEVAQPAGDGQFVTTEKDVNVAVTMHVTTQDEITTISKKIEDAARNEMIGSNLRFWLTLGAILLVIFALTVIVDFGKKRWGW